MKLRRRSRIRNAAAPSGRIRVLHGNVRIGSGLFVLHQALLQDFILIRKYAAEEFPYYAIRLQRRSFAACLQKLKKRFNVFDVVCLIRNNPNPVCLYNKLRMDPEVSTRGNDLKCEISEARLLDKIEMLNDRMIGKSRSRRSIRSRRCSCASRSTGFGTRSERR